jgi:FKBP-type peptidyl-prolyl cis-trans isomerase SlyD
VEIAADRVVLIHYTLKDDDGAVIDSSAGGEPLAYIQGHGNLVTGLEKALEGKRDGNTVAVSVPPEEGYGRHDAALIQRVPKRSMQGSGEIKKGMQFQARTGDGMRLFTVTAVVGDMVTLDGNHPLADQTLHFDVEVVSVRAATAEELEHGHVHGAGGHHH